MAIPIYQIDAFTDRLFQGNPAAVCPLERWLPDETLQAIATENNLSDTAFYVHEADGIMLRWFTPAAEIDLCGHATLATAYAMLEIRRESAGPAVEFNSKSGKLSVERSGDLYVLDFPARPPAECAFDAALSAALGATPALTLASRDYFCVFETEEEVRALRPNMEKVAALDRIAVIATAPGRDCDFVSRFFAPQHGIPEDPVTGSAHCTLTPYWSKRLGKTKLHARQVSRRGGELWCEDRGGRVRIGGRAAVYSQGAIEIAM